MQFKFIPKEVVLTDLFATDIVYIIPPYQRPYSWDCIGKSDKNNQVNVMWEDLIECYERKNSDVYFLGSMVLIEKGGEREYEVVDGQQRLTTLTILLVAIKCFLQDIKEKDSLKLDEKPQLIDFIDKAIDRIEGLIFNKTIIGVIEKEKKVKIARSTGFDYDHVLKNVMNCANISSINLKNATTEQRAVTKRFFDNQSYLKHRIAEKFTNQHIFTYQSALELNAFIEFLKRKVTVVQILAPSFDIAYQIFGVLNNRGLPLSNKDLFRNFLISEFQQLKNSDVQPFAAIDANKKWSDLDDNFDLDPEFISRYVESKKAQNQKFSAYNDLLEIYKGIKPTLQEAKIEVFYEDLKKYLHIYTQIIETNFSNKTINVILPFLLNAGNIGYTLNLLLALFYHIKDDTKIIRFLSEYERYTCLTLLSSTKRFASKPIYKAIECLNNQRFDEAIEVFEMTIADKHSLISYLDMPIKDNDLGKLLIAKSLWMDIDEDVVTPTLDYDKATLEHIIPQTPDTKTNWMKDFTDAFRRDYTYKLGNMTLLTQKLNSAAKNYDFSKKKLTYDKTKLATTKNIAEQTTITPLFIEQRHQKILTKLRIAFDL
jgi:uncharacterized protein with ParB-like and HNH nuclease domain